MLVYGARTIKVTKLIYDLKNSESLRMDHVYFTWGINIVVWKVV